MSLKRRRRTPAPKTLSFTNQHGVVFRAGDRILDTSIEGEPRGTVIETSAAGMLVRWDWRELGRSKIGKRWACSVVKAS